MVPFKRLLAALLVVGMAGRAACADEFDNPKAKIPPEAHQNRISGGESFPPLPLPATPLRRTERKREPAPPALVGKINLNVVDGQKISNYPTVTLDIENLMNYTNSALHLRYRYVETDLSKFSYSPTELPVLYITGWTPLPKFSEAVKDRLRAYVTAGGTLIVHANCGRPEFIQSFRAFQRELFPDRPLAPLPPDHPLYHCLNDVERMRFRKDHDDFKESRPYLEAMNMGCRAAIIFSPIDISWGWDVSKRPIDGGVLYDQADSLHLGANILTYVLANYEYGRAFQFEKVYHQADLPTRDQLVVAQLQHNGDWDPTPHGLPNLLKFIDTNSTLSVQFKRTTVSLDNLSALDQPVIYMTGLRAFTLTAAEEQRLRDYLNAGGILFAESAMGADSFDAAFRAEIAKLLPNGKLEPLPPNHPIYSNVFKINQVNYSKVLESVTQDTHVPLIEAVTRDGAPQIIYSKWSLSNGWEQLPNPYAKSYADDDALKLGTNILVYTLTH